MIDPARPSLRMQSTIHDFQMLCIKTASSPYKTWENSYYNYSYQSYNNATQGQRLTRSTGANP